MTQDQINEGKLLAKQSIEFALRYTHNCKTVKEVRDAIVTLFGDEVDGALRAEMFGRVQPNDKVSGGGTPSA